MAIEAPNTFVAGALLTGSNGIITVVGSSGLRVATYQRVSEGLYTVELDQAVARAALCCHCGAIDDAAVPLVAYAGAQVSGDDTIIGITIVDAAGDPKDGTQIHLSVFRFNTAG